MTIIFKYFNFYSIDIDSLSILERKGTSEQRKWTVHCRIATWAGKASNCCLHHKAFTRDDMTGPVPIFYKSDRVRVRRRASFYLAGVKRKRPDATGSQNSKPTHLSPAHRSQDGRGRLKFTRAAGWTRRLSSHLFSQRQPQPRGGNW